MRLLKAAAGSALGLTWDPGTGIDSYTVYEDPFPDGAFGSSIGTSTLPGLIVPMPADTLYYLVTGTNLYCGEGPLH